MPGRKIPLVTGETYHVLNRGVNKQPVFKDAWDYQRIIDVLHFYQFAKPPVRFSFYNRLKSKEKEELLSNMEKNSSELVSILAFCFMPNHFHLLLKQEHENGISKFLSNFQNSFTKYFNLRHNRTGHLLQGQFKAVRIEDENQLIHVSRYIHLNPYTSYVVRSVDELKKYLWSSLPFYIQEDESICETQTVLSLFPSSKKYLQFVLDQKDYQRTLEQIKHLTLE